MKAEDINGFVRPAVTLSAMAGMVYGFLTGGIGPDVFVPFATGVITWWFKSRDDEKKN